METKMLDCPECWGRGYIYGVSTIAPYKCFTCRGTGRVNVVPVESVDIETFRKGIIGDE